MAVDLYNNIWLPYPSPMARQPIPPSLYPSLCKTLRSGLCSRYQRRQRDYINVERGGVSRTIGKN